MRTEIIVMRGKKSSMGFFPNVNKQKNLVHINMNEVLVIKNFTK